MAARIRLITVPAQHDDVANSVAGAIVLASPHVRPLNFHPPIIGPGRSEWIAAGGFGHPGGGLPISTADGMGGSTEKPGGWPPGLEARQGVLYGQ